MPAPMVSRTLSRRPVLAHIEHPVVLVGAVVLCVVLGYGLSRWPLLGLLFLVSMTFAMFPGLSRCVIICIAAVGPTFNPPVLGIGAGRLYVVQALIVGVVIGGLASATRNGLSKSAVTLVTLVFLLVLLETIGRPSAGIAWAYRPLQLFLVAFAVRSLFVGRDHRHLLLALGWGSAVGCGLAAVHAVLPTLDPFVFSRPTDLPFVSTIGSYVRATGAFTYPNNLGTFAAYTVLFGASSWLLDRPSLSSRLSVAMMCSGFSALVFSGSRAAGLGLIFGLVYLTAKAAPKRRTLILAAEGLIGLALLVAVVNSPTALEVVNQRASSAAGISLFGRIGAFQEPIRSFLASPIIGAGSTESNLDNVIILYVSQTGILGMLLFAGIARCTLKTGKRKQFPELMNALLIALGISGMLQDSLGQTLSTWFIGTVLGLSMLSSSAISKSSSVREPLGSQRVATTR